MSLTFNMVSRFGTAFLPRSKQLLISWLQSPSMVILEPKKIKFLTVSTVCPSICHEVMGPDIVIFVFWILSFKPGFSLSSFTFIKRLYSSSYFLLLGWKVKSLSHFRLSATPWTVAYHAPPSMGFSRQEYWNGLPFPSSEDLPDPGIKPRSLHCRHILFCLSHQGSPLLISAVLTLILFTNVIYTGNWIVFP